MRGTQPENGPSEREQEIAAERFDVGRSFHVIEMGDGGTGHTMFIDPAEDDAWIRCQNVHTADYADL